MKAEWMSVCIVPCILMAAMACNRTTPTADQSIGFAATQTSPALVLDAATRAGEPGDFVDVGVAIPSAVIDIRYATANNFVGHAVYPRARCLLRRSVAEALVRVAEAAAARELRLHIWDCYRPFSVQEELWKVVPDPRYVARPVRKDGVPVEGSKHSRGAAVDLTLERTDGVLLEMPTDYDDFSSAAHRNATSASRAQAENVRLLETLMVAEGFTPLPTEWWHFDGPGWRDFPLADEPL